MAERDNRLVIAFKLEGSSQDDGLVRFSDFATFVEGTLATLRALERSETNNRHARIEYRVTRLEVSSAALTVEAVDTPDLRAIEARVVQRLAQGLSAVRDGVAGLAMFEPAVREGFSKMLAPLRRGVRSVIIDVGDNTIALVGRPTAMLDLMETKDELAAVGSFSGSVDALNVHGDHFFYLYPPVGPVRIKCIFDTSLLDDVRAAVKRYTTVYGLVEYVEPSPFPSRIIVERLVPHPAESELPSLSQLWGTAPDITGGVDEVEFIRRIRDVE